MRHRRGDVLKRIAHVPHVGYDVQRRAIMMKVYTVHRENVGVMATE